MAYTVNKFKSVFGDKRIVGMNVTADAATQTIETGLKIIDYALRTTISAATNNFKFSVNSNASGVQSMGVISVTGLVSGDFFYVVVFGR